MQKNQRLTAFPITITLVAKPLQSHVIEGAEPCQSNSPLLLQLNDSTTQQLNDSTTQRLNNSTNQPLNHLTNKTNSTNRTNILKELIMKLKLTEELWKEGNMYVSYCPELDIASCGENVDQAKKNLKEVILINLEEAKKLGTIDDLLQEAGFDEAQGILASRKELVGFTPIEVAI
jgi:predicted RNase H-like HicB family nuclease